jgi:hypothetical protein
LAETIQDAPAASDAPDRLTELDPAVAVAVPPQVLVKPFGVDTCSPEGRVSAKPIPLSAVPPFGLLTWKVKVVDPLRATEVAPNALVIEGGATTVTDAVPVFPVPAFVEVTCTLLFFTPAVAPWTFTETVHEPLDARDPPDRLTEDDPATAVADP